MKESIGSLEFPLSSYEQELKSNYLSGNKFLVDNPLTFKKFVDYLNQGKIVVAERTNYYKSMSQKQLGYTVNEVESITDGKSVEIVIHPRYSYPVLHNHAYIEIMYVYSGQAVQFIEDKVNILKKGMLCVLAPNSKHALSVNNDETIVINVLVSKNVFRNEVLQSLKSSDGNDTLYSFIKHILFGKKVSPYLIVDTKNNSIIRNMVLTMVKERENKLFKYDICIQLLLQRIFIEINRNYNNISQELPRVVQDDNDLRNSIIAYLQLNYNKTNLKEMASFFGYSPKYFGILIKRNTGLSFKENIEHLQVAHAIELIKNTSLSLTEISQEVGCFDASHLTKKFKHLKGKSPNTFRNSAGMTR